MVEPGAVGAVVGGAAFNGHTAPVQHNGAAHGQLWLAVVIAGLGSLRAFAGQALPALQQLAAKYDLPIVAPPPRLCTDNAAMIAWAGIERLRLGERSGFDYAPRPRWPLDSAAPALAGAGVKA